jgi:hypothetical protein
MNTATASPGCRDTIRMACVHMCVAQCMEMSALPGPVDDSKPEVRHSFQARHVHTVTPPGVAHG